MGDKADFSASEDEALSAVLGYIDEACDEVKAEFKRAATKHGLSQTPANPFMSQGERVIIMGEEYGEVCRAMTYDEGSMDKLNAELVQLACMAIASRVGNRIKSMYGEV